MQAGNSHHARMRNRGTVIDSFAAVLREELALQLQDEQMHRATAEERLASVKARISNLVDQLEGDAEMPRSVLARLEAEEDEVTAALAVLPAGLSPTLPVDHEVMYRQAIES